MNNKSNRTGVLRQLTALRDMDRKALEDKWRDLFGTEPPKFRRNFLQKRLAYRIQELFYGGLDNATKNKIEEVADRVENKKPNPKIEVDGQILPGTRFVREWKGQRYETTVREGGFEYNGIIYTSLSAVASAITGTQWNGRKWWGLSASHKRRTKKH